MALLPSLARQIPRNDLGRGAAGNLAIVQAKSVLPGKWGVPSLQGNLSCCSGSSCGPVWLVLGMLVAWGRGTFPEQQVSLPLGPSQLAKVQDPKTMEQSSADSHHTPPLARNQLAVVFNSCPCERFTKDFKFTSLPSQVEKKKLNGHKEGISEGEEGWRGGCTVHQ